MDRPVIKFALILGPTCKKVCTHNWTTPISEKYCSGVWHGSASMASYSVSGGYLNNYGQVRDPSKMFDNNINTMWVSKWSGGASAKITFKHNIYFVRLEIVKRRDKYTTR